MSPTPYHHRPRRRPPWWPENETWPPKERTWRGKPGRFFWRTGCLITLLYFLAFTILVVFVGLAAHFTGILQLSTTLRWAIPFGLALFTIGFAALAWTVRNVRRISAPFADLMGAAEKIAEGDYSVRVREVGPAEVRTLSRTFNRMASRLQTSDAQRRDFLANVTHELRTPLTVIQGNLEGMLDGVYSPDDARLKSILEETQVLARLVDDLRTLALAESGALELRVETIDLSTFVEEVTMAFSSQAKLGDVALTVSIVNEPPPVQLDPERIRQVLTNLLLNALRYTPPGGTIQVRLDTENNQGGRYAVVEIEDSGSGIKIEDLAHVFDRFYKGSDSGGMGLGLSIARQLVEIHGGSIVAESQSGAGTTIRFSLPVE